AVCGGGGLWGGEARCAEDDGADARGADAFHEARVFRFTENDGVAVRRGGDEAFWVGLDGYIGNVVVAKRVGGEACFRCHAEDQDMLFFGGIGGVCRDG